MQIVSKGLDASNHRNRSRKISANIKVACEVKNKGSISGRLSLFVFSFSYFVFRALRNSIYSQTTYYTERKRLLNIMANLKIVLFSCSRSCLHLEFSHAIITRLRALFGKMTYFYILRATMIRHGAETRPFHSDVIKNRTTVERLHAKLRMNVNTNALLLTFSSLQNKSSSPSIY